MQVKYHWKDWQSSYTWNQIYLSSTNEETSCPFQSLCPTAPCAYLYPCSYYIVLQST